METLSYTKPLIGVPSLTSATLCLIPGGFHWEHIPVKDEKPPSQHQVQEFVRIVDRCRDNGQVGELTLQSSSSSAKTNMCI